MFTASLPPSIVASTLRALTRLQEQPELRTRLHDNARRYHSGLQAVGFEVGPVPSPVVSVVLQDRDLAVAFWNALLQSGLYLNLALPPATPTSSPLLRSSVSAAHTTAQIDEALAIFAEVGRQMGVLPAPLRRAAAGD
jgi:8-amino-7-oxononanoate synthase